MTKIKKHKRERDRRPPFSDKIGNLSPDDPDRLPPIFSFEMMEESHDYCINKCDDALLSALAKKMFTLSRMTWKDIRNAPRHGLGSETIDRNAITAPIPNKVPSDTTFLALRVMGKKPLVGYRIQRVFYVLYIDKNYTLYKH